MSLIVRLIIPRIFILAAVALTGTFAWAADRVEIRQGPDGWRAESPRTEIAPRFAVDSAKDGQDPYVLRIAGGALAASSGWWTKEFDVQPGTWYRFEANFQAKHVDTERRSVLARLTRFDKKGRQIDQPEYPPTETSGTTINGWNRIADRYAMGDRCTKVRVELLLRWSAGGEVAWRDIQLAPAASPEPRRVKVCTIQYRPGRRTKGPDENLDLFAAMIEKAAQQKPDIICLGEGITVVNTGQSYVDVAESIPGKSTKRLTQLSKTHDCYIVAGIYERVGKTVYNTSVLTGPAGEIVGTYRKTCLPREEIEGGITPGDQYPVFDTRFGKVGMMICWDIHFPEVARQLANHGAELILVPIWGGNEKLVQARAIENQVYVATSSYSPKMRSAIFDRHGDALATATDDERIAIAEIDLNERTYFPWLGDFRSRILRERPPTNKK